MSCGALWPQLLAAGWGGLGPARESRGLPAVGVLPPQGAGCRQGWSCHPKGALAMPAQPLQQNEEPEIRGTSRAPNTVPMACRRDGHVCHPMGLCHWRATTVGVPRHPWVFGLGAFLSGEGGGCAVGARQAQAPRAASCGGGRCWLCCSPPQSPTRLRLDG